MELKEAIEKIESFRDLKKNWNGYGAEPISDIVINKALKLIKELRPIPSEIVPTYRKSIQFQWGEGDLYLEMQIFKNTIEIFNASEYCGEVVTIGDD